MHTPSKWWRDGGVGLLLADSLSKASLWLDFQYYGPDGGRMKKVSLGDLEELSCAWTPGGFVLRRQRQRDDTDSTSLKLIVREAYFAAWFVFGEEAADLRRPSLFERLAIFTKRMYRAMSDRAWLSQGTVFVTDPFPTSRPPPVSTACFSPGALVGFYDREYIRTKLEQPKQAAAMAKAALPKAATRELDGNLVHICWTPDSLDLDVIDAARSDQAEWLIEHGCVEFDERYNEAGDLMVEASGMEEHPPLTYFDPAYEIGYKAVAPKASGALPDEIWAQLSKWSTRGRLPDGTHLEAVRLIVPKRNLALKMLPAARAHGVDAILYADREGRWWDPVPPGPWLEKKTNDDAP
jgi:hypothetical protein